MGSKSGGSRTDTVVKLVLIFFISLLSFSVGTFVGKQVSDSDYRRAALEEDYGMPSRTTASAEEEKTENKISDEEIASLTEEFVNNEKQAVEETAKAEAVKETEEAIEEVAKVDTATDNSGYKKYNNKNAEAETTKPVADHKAVEKIVETKVEPKKVEKVAAREEKPLDRSPSAARVAEGKAPTPDPKEETRKPDTVLPSVATSAIGKFTVQVASYADETEAKNHAATLKTKGWNAFYIPAQVNGHTWYRVSVGLFTTAKSANEFRAELMKEANLQSALVQKIVK